MLSGAVPQISLICGPCAGGAAYSPALTDFIIQTRQAQMFITGPQVIKQVTGEEVTAEQLGGPDAHMSHSGVIHFVAEDDHDAVCHLPAAAELPAVQQPGGSAASARPTAMSDPNPELDDDRARTGKQALRRARGHRGRRGRRATSWKCRPASRRTSSSASPASLGRSIGIIANQPSVPGRRARHQRLEQGRALHPLLQRVQHPAA